MDAKSLSITDRLWIRVALTEIREGRSFSVTVHGRDGRDIFQRYRHLAERLFDVPLALPVEMVTVGTLTIPIKAVVPLLAAAGSVIAAGGAVAFIAAYAEKHGFSVAPSYNAGLDAFDASDDAFTLTMTRDQK